MSVENMKISAVTSLFTKKEEKKFMKWCSNNGILNCIKQFADCTDWHFSANDAAFLSNHWETEKQHWDFWVVLMHDLTAGEECGNKGIAEHLNNVLNKDRMTRLFFMNVVFWNFGECIVKEARKNYMIKHCYDHSYDVDYQIEITKFVEMLKKATGITKEIVAYVPELGETNFYGGLRLEELRCILALCYACNDLDIAVTVKQMKNHAKTVDFSKKDKSAFSVVICGPKNNEAVFRFFERQENFRFYEKEGKWIFACNGNKFHCNSDDDVQYAFIGKVVLEEGMPECLLVCGIHGQGSFAAIQYVILHNYFELETGSWYFVRCESPQFIKWTESDFKIIAKGKVL